MGCTGVSNSPKQSTTPTPSRTPTRRVPDVGSETLTKRQKSSQTSLPEIPARNNARSKARPTAQPATNVKSNDLLNVADGKPSGTQEKDKKNEKTVEGLIQTVKEETANLKAIAPETEKNSLVRINNRIYKCLNAAIKDLDTSALPPLLETIVSCELELLNIGILDHINNTHLRPEKKTWEQVVREALMTGNNTIGSGGLVDLLFNYHSESCRRCISLFKSWRPHFILLDELRFICIRRLNGVTMTTYEPYSTNYMELADITSSESVASPDPGIQRNSAEIRTYLTSLFNDPNKRIMFC